MSNPRAANGNFGGNVNKSKFLVLIVLVIIVLGISSAFYFLWNTKQNNEHVKVGIFHYVWHNTADSNSWDGNKIVDTPMLSIYNSSNLSVIKQHLKWIQELRIDFLIISWWGTYDLPYVKGYTDNATRQIFETIKNTNSSIKAALMVEPFNQTGYKYNYSEIYNHIYSQFVTAYPSIYYKIEGKPLICFFNNQSLTPNGEVPYNDTRFSTTIVGTEDYANWIYTDANYYVTPRNIPHSNQMSVTPRFDDSRFRTPSCKNDTNLTDQLYNREWENAIKLAKDQKIDIVTITSWNEYVERTAIEPHYDATAYNHDPFFLFNETKHYIELLKN